MLSRLLRCGASALAMICCLPNAHAHHPSTTGGTGVAGPINVISATTLEQGAIAVSVTYEVIKINAFSDAELAAFARTQDEVHSLDRILAPAVGLAYGVTDNLTVSLRLPYVKRSDIREVGEHHEAAAHGGADEPDEDSGEVIARGDASGFGDLSLLGEYRFLGNGASSAEMAVLLGVKAPTGRTGVVDRNGELFETEFQPGSGAWDGMFGLAATQRLGVASLHAHILYVLTGNGAQDTDLGDRVSYGVAVSYRMLGNDDAHGHQPAAAHAHAHGGSANHHEVSRVRPTLDLVLELNGEWADQEVVAGLDDQNSGGHTLYLSPGVRVSIDNWAGFASVGIPIANELNGVQAEPEWRLITGIAVGF